MKRGCIIVTNGYTKVPNLVLDSYAQILSMPAYIIYLRLFRLSHGFRQKHCRVSLRTLERSCGLVQKTVVRGLQNLLDEGFIEISDPGNVTKATEYRILVPAVTDTAPPAVSKTEPLRDEIPQESAVSETVIKQSSNINTTTTNSDDQKNEVDFSSLKFIGFADHHAKKLIGLYSTELVQESIDAFAFDLQFNRKAKSIKGSPINFFMGILMKGPYSPPENFKSRKQKAEALEREKVQKIENDKILAQNEVLEKRRAVLRKIVDREFTRWLSRLADDRRKEIVPVLARKSENLERVCLRNHFEEHVLKISINTMSEAQLSGLFKNINQIIMPR